MSWEDEKDDWEGNYGEIIKSFPSGVRLAFDYTSKTGKSSSRIVQVREFGETGFGIMLIGFCEARQGKRTFVASRIANCKNADTQETVADVASYLDEHYRKSVDFILDKLFSDFFDDLRILIYFFRVDGRILANERNKLLELCLELTGDIRIGDKQVKELVDCFPQLSINSFKVEVGRLSKNNRSRLLRVKKICEDCIAAKKSPSALELDTIAYIEKRLNKP